MGLGHARAGDPTNCGCVRICWMSALPVAHGGAQAAHQTMADSKAPLYGTRPSMPSGTSFGAGGGVLK